MDTQVKDNLELWKKVEETDPKHTKEVLFGRKFTSINAQYQLMQATEQFGTYGKGWGIESIDYEYIELNDNHLMALVKSIFFFIAEDVKSSFPVSTSIIVKDLDKGGKFRYDDEFAKKAETDITTKALSKLGFSADVFLGRYDDNRYVNSLNEKFGNDTKPKKEDKKTQPQNVPFKKLTQTEVDKWNGKIYKGKNVYIDNVQYEIGIEQIEKLKKLPNYKPE